MARPPFDAYISALLEAVEIDDRTPFESDDAMTDWVFVRAEIIWSERESTNAEA